MKPLQLIPSCALLLSMMIAATAWAQDAPHSADDISRKLNDPGAALISVPIQYNYLGDVGPDGDHNQQLKIQPVIPFVGDHGKFLLRPILPYQWNEFPERSNGLGDLFVQGYFIPTHAGQESATEIGFGAAALIDTASHDSLGTGKYSIGPAFVLIYKAGKWTMGALGNHIWSVAGDNDRGDVSQTSVQPFFSRQLPHGWSFSITSETSYNWEASSGNKWTVPLGGTVSKVLRFGRMPVSLSGGGFYNVERPDFANRWTARLAMTLVFPE